MGKLNDIQIYSGATPEEVSADLQPLLDFQEEGLSIKQLEKLLNKKLIPHLIKYNLPGFQSMFNSFPEKGAEFGARIALAFNQGVTNWQVSPGGAILEELCCQKLCQLFGLSPKADATFMYSGTYANQQAIYLALHRKAELSGFDFGEKGLMGFKNPSKLVVLTSTDAHFSIKHAIRMLGLGEQNLFTLDVDINRRINIRNLKKNISKIQKNKDIFCIVATAGTTSTGSIDPIRALAKVGKKVDAWLHVDGAYGLAYRLVPEWKDLFTGIELADSVTWDPHKQFGTPIPNSILFVADKEDFNRMSIHSSYFNKENENKPNPGLKSPPSTRPLSALALVTSIRFQGMQKVITRLRTPLLAIRTLGILLEREREIELVHQPETGILCFRIKPEGFPEDQLNDLQKFIYDKIMEQGTRSISITQIDNKTVLRLVVVSPTVSIEALVATITDLYSTSHDFPRMEIKNN
jgi:L-2,4-diaminobutyrate decarboxylase